MRTIIATFVLTAAMVASAASYHDHTHHGPWSDLDATITLVKSGVGVQMTFSLDQDSGPPNWVTDLTFYAPAGTIGAVTSLAGSFDPPVFTPTPGVFTFDFAASGDSNSLFDSGDSVSAFFFKPGHNLGVPDFEIAALSLSGHLHPHLAHYQWENGTISGHAGFHVPEMRSFGMFFATALGLYAIHDFRGKRKFRLLNSKSR